MKRPFQDNRQSSAKAIFSVTIDFNYNYRQNRDKDDIRLSPGGRYYLKNKRNETATAYEDISDFVANVIVGDLAEVCNQYLDAPVTLSVNGRYDGSLVLVFSAVFNAIQFISGIKDIYDIAQLIRDLAKERIEKRLEKEYGDVFDVNVAQRLPGNRDRYDLFELQHLMRKGRFPFSLQLDAPESKRDAFFWYLLASNIILATSVILLVIKAVLKVYG
jgi:hypothetical protein